jgi:hypothetical protein
MAMKEKEIHKLKKVFEGFKDLGSTSTIHQFSYLVVFVEKVTYNFVNLKDQNSLRS